MRRTLLLLLLTACARNAMPPEGLLERGAFVDALAGATLLEARMNRSLMVAPMDGVPMDSLYARLFAEQGISREDFERTFDHYAGRPDEMRAIYEEVVERLRVQKDSALQRLPRNEAMLATDSLSGRNR
jgi:hypothetical protein